MTTLKGANTTAQWYYDNYGGTLFPRIDKFVIHTTETESWPGYGGGASAPNATYHPRRREIRQHFPNERSSRALRDPSSTAVRENRDNVFQLEVICYSDKRLGDTVGGLWVGDLTQSHFDDIARMCIQLHKEMGLSLTTSVRWKPGQKTYVHGVRLSGPQFDAYRGILGHVHVSGNSHWDPGGFYASRLMASIARLLGDDVSPPTPKPPTPEEEVTVIVSEYGSSQFVRIDMDYPYVERLSEGTFKGQKTMPGVKYQLMTNAQINTCISLQGYRDRQVRASIWNTPIMRDGQPVPALQELANILTDVKRLVAGQEVGPWQYKGSGETRDAYAYLRGIDRRLEEVLKVLAEEDIPAAQARGLLSAVSAPSLADLNVERASDEDVAEAEAPEFVEAEIPHASEVMPPGMTYEPDEDEAGTDQ